MKGVFGLVGFLVQLFVCVSGSNVSYGQESLRLVFYNGLETAPGCVYQELNAQLIFDNVNPAFVGAPICWEYRFDGYSGIISDISLPNAIEDYSDYTDYQFSAKTLITDAPAMVLMTFKIARDIYCVGYDCTTGGNICGVGEAWYFSFGGLPATGGTLLSFMSIYCPSFDIVAPDLAGMSLNVGDLLELSSDVSIPCGTSSPEYLWEIYRNGEWETIASGFESSIGWEVSGSPADDCYLRVIVSGFLDYDCTDSTEDTTGPFGILGPSGLPDGGTRIIQLWQCAPNPFNPQTTITFELPNREAVLLRVYDVTGCLVRVLVDGEVYDQGRHEAVWRGQDDSGRQCASGTYFYCLEAGTFSETKRMVLLK